MYTRILITFAQNDTLTLLHLFSTAHTLHVHDTDMNGRVCGALVHE